MASVRVNKRDISIAFDRLIVDARDDFWPDPYRYADLTSVKAEVVNEYVKVVNSMLSTNPINPKTHSVYHWDVPKSNNVVRHAVLLNPFDRLVYHVLLNRLCRDIEPRLEKPRYSYRISKFNDKYLFGKKGVDHWLAFKADITDAVTTGKLKYLVSTDIAGFFEYVHLTDFRRQMENLTEKENKPFVELLYAFLRKVAMSNHSGIPQNYDPSSYFCTAFLDFLDKDLLAKGLKHFRYVDDIKVACRTRKDAQLAIIEIIHSLRKMNLNVQSSKTQIWHETDPEFREFAKKFPPLLTAIDKATESKDKDLISSLLPKLLILTRTEMKKTPFDERIFRACIRRIVKCHYFSNVKIPSLTSIVNRSFKLMTQMPGRSDTIVDFLSLYKNNKGVQERTFALIKDVIYFWQEMKLWELLVKSTKIKVPAVLAYARKKLERGIGNPVMNLVLLCLGRHGNYNDRLHIARLFEQQHSVYTRRHILIAIQEYRDRNEIYNRVLDGDDLLLISVVRHIRQLAKPMYTYEDPQIASQVAEGYEG